MKTLTTIILLAVIQISSFTQTYLIGFSGTGESTSVDSVKVKNLTQDVELSLAGTDILRLTVTTGLDNVILDNEEKIRIFPNPSFNSATIEFITETASNVSVSIYDIQGKRILHQNDQLNTGNHAYSISGLRSGIYTLKVNSDHFDYSGQIVSKSNSKENIHMNYIGKRDKPLIKGQLKNTNAEIDMDYHIGDILLFIGYSAHYTTVKTDIPTDSKTLTFNFVTCTDGNGQHYSIVEQGSQIWMAENLNSSCYADSTAIPYVTSDSDWKNLEYNDTAFCWFENDSATYSGTYGALYTWTAAMRGQNSSTANPSGVQGVCPNGWHLPSDAEWKELEMYLGMSEIDADTTLLRGTDEAGKMKETGIVHWHDPNVGATNESGFTALPAGRRKEFDGAFDAIYYLANFWSSTENQGFYAYYRRIYSDYPQIARRDYYKSSGFSVRCVKD